MNYSSHSAPPYKQSPFPAARPVSHLSFGIDPLVESGYQEEEYEYEDEDYEVEEELAKLEEVEDGA
jgi:hypothetical protein